MRRGYNTHWLSCEEDPSLFLDRRLRRSVGLMSAAPRDSCKYIRHFSNSSVSTDDRPFLKVQTVYRIPPAACSLHVIWLEYFFIQRARPSAT